MMPDRMVDMQEVLGRLTAALGHPPVCTACGHDRGGVNAVRVAIWPPGTSLAVNVIGGPVLPMLTTGCSRCGHTDFYNLVNLGFIPNSDGVLLQPELPSKADADTRRIIDQALGDDRRYTQH